MPEGGGVPLSHYLQHGADVDLICTAPAGRYACAKRRVVPLATAIAELGSDFPITEVGGRARKPCECGALAWRSQPLWPKGEPKLR